MGGSKRSNRLAARKPKSGHNRDSESEDDDDERNSTKLPVVESEDEDEGESDLHPPGGDKKVDDTSNKSTVPPAKSTSASAKDPIPIIIRRGKMDKDRQQRKLPPETSTKSSSSSSAKKSKNVASASSRDTKMKSLSTYFTPKAKKPTGAGADGNDHAEDNGDDRGPKFLSTYFTPKRKEPTKDADGNDHANAEDKKDDRGKQQKVAPQKGSKRSRPNSDSSGEFKKSKMSSDSSGELKRSKMMSTTGEDNKKSPPKVDQADDKRSKPTATVGKAKPGDGPPAPQPLNKKDKDNPEASVKEVPPSANVDRDGESSDTKRISARKELDKDGERSDTKDVTAQKGTEPKAKGKTVVKIGGNTTPAVDEKKRASPAVDEKKRASTTLLPKEKSPPSSLTKKLDDAPSSSSTLENGGKPAASCKSGIIKQRNGGMIDQSSTRPKNDSKERPRSNIADNEPTLATKKVGTGKIDQTKRQLSAGSSLQVDGQRKSSHIDKNVTTNVKDTAKVKRPRPDTLLLKDGTTTNKPKKALSSGVKPSASTKVIKDDGDGDSHSKIRESNAKVATTDERENLNSLIKTERSDDRPNNDGNAISGLATPEQSSIRDLADKPPDARSRIVSAEPTALTPMETESPPTLKIKVGDSRVASDEPNNIATGSDASMMSNNGIISQPKQRTRRSPSVGQVKMALFLEASKAHRGNGPERMFAKYWQALEKYITLGSHNDGTTRRLRSDLSASFSGIESTLKGFLKTRKMKRLHNKLVLAVTAEAMSSKIPERCSSHVPQHWQTKAIQSSPDQVDEKVLGEVNSPDRNSDLRQWKADFGPNSGTWTVCGNEIALTKTDVGESIRPHLVSSIQKGELDAEEVLPSARLPGALEIEPMVRKHTANSGLTASENAIWMLVVAVREHSASLIKKVIANDKIFAEGYAPERPAQFQTSLACRHLTAGNGDGLKGENATQKDNIAKSSRKKSGTKVINSASLSHVLDDHNSAASRLTSMYSAIASGGGGNASCFPGLDNANCIINASIERAASRRQASSERRKPASSIASQSTMTSSTQPNINSKAQSDGRLSKLQQPSLHLSPPISMPVNLPQLSAQRTNQSMHPPLPPQSHMVPPSMPSQIMQPPRSAQMMNHSDHQKGTKPVDTQTVSIPSVEPLTKPGFPSITHSSQKSEPTKSSAPVPKTASPPPRATGRGSKNLAAMMARPTSQPKPSSDKVRAAGDDKKANGGSLDKNAAPEQKDKAEEKKDGEKEAKPPASAPACARGRGFGVKNLSRMRARASFTEPGK